MSDLTIRPATPEQVPAVLGWTHALWGDDLTLPAYIARTQSLQTSPWGLANYRFWLASDASGAPVSACKVYRLQLVVGGRSGSAIGFGAVFTPEHVRGHGHAAALLRGVMAQARAEGVDWALLFSDIGPAYYARLGFNTIGALKGEAEALASASPFRPLSEADEALLPGWWAGSSPEFAFVRTPDYWAYLCQRDTPKLWAYAPDGGRARGYVAVYSGKSRLGLLAAGKDADVDETAFWLGLRALAGSLGQPHVGGWLPPEAGSAGFTLSLIADGVPMVASLAGGKVPHPASVWALDHF